MSAEETATEVVQAVAKPVAFIATTIAAAITVGLIVRKLGRSLPVPDYVGNWATPVDDEDQGDTEDDE